LSSSLTGFRWSLAQLVDYARDPRACDLAAVRDAVRRYEYEEALARTFARILVRQPITTELLAEVLPYSCTETVFTISLIALAEGDRARALVEAAERNRFPEDELGATMRALALHAAWILDGGTHRERIAAQAQRMATRWRGGNPEQIALTSLIEALVRETRPGALARRGEHAISHDLALLHWALTSPRADVEQALVRAIDPNEPEPKTGLGLIPAVATAPPKAGRNEPCPCGSGKKYKRCHGAEAEGRAMTPRSLSVAEVRALAFRDVAGLELAMLSDDALDAAFLRFLERPAWPLVTDALDQLAARPTISREHMDEARVTVIQTAVAARRYDIAQREFGKLGPSHSLPPMARCALALQARTADALDHLWRAAELAVRDESFARDFELAILLIHLIPALGLLVARGCDASDEWRAEVLANLTDEARAELGLPAGDRTRDIQAAVRQDQAHGAEMEAANVRAADLRAALDRSQDRTRELERRVLTLEEQLRRPPAAPAEPTAPADPAEVRSLRAKIEDLQEMVRQRNASLTQLRRQLEEAAEAAGAPGASPRPPRPPSRRR
jgi:SEC-C motif-containing protein